MSFFYYFDVTIVTYTIKVLIVSKYIIFVFCVFQTRVTLFVGTSDIEKINNYISQPKFSFLCDENLVSQL